MLAHRLRNLLATAGLLLATVSSARAQEPATESTSNPYAGDFLSRSRFLGDPWGVRSAVAEHGLSFDLFSTQFYQRTAAGGQSRSSEFGGKLDYLVNVDGHKLGLWSGFFVNVHGETRYGTDVNGLDGLIAPSNIAMNFPEPGRNITSLTGLKFTQALGENFAVYLGKINTLDEYPLRYSLDSGANKPGLEGFLNTSLVFNPIVARTVPYAAAGVGAAYLRDGEPAVAFTVFDPEERSAKGLEDLYARGATFVTDIDIAIEPFGRPGFLNLGGTYSNARYRSFDPAAYLNILSAVLQNNPGDIDRSPEETGSWSIYANGYQSIWVDPCDKKRTWGFFGQFGLSDGNPNPIRFVANGGIGGHSMLPGRKLDTFGIGYFYLGLSDNFKALALPIRPQRDEFGVEMFYNFAITPWCRLTGDLQIARPSTIGFGTAIIPGIRLQMLF